MLGLALLFLFNVLGIRLHDYAHIPLPGNVLGMLLLLAALSTRLVKLSWIEQPADLLLRHMMLFFVPVIVAVMPLFPALAANALPISAGLLLSTLATMTATAWCCQRMLPKGPGGGEEKHG